MRRAIADVFRAVRFREDKPAIQNLLQKGLVGDDLLSSLLAAEKELEGEVREVCAEANTFVEGWGSLIFPTANEIIANERMRAMFESTNKLRAEKGEHIFTLVLFRSSERVTDSRSVEQNLYTERRARISQESPSPTSKSARHHKPPPPQAHLPSASLQPARLHPLHYFLPTETCILQAILNLSPTLRRYVFPSLTYHSLLMLVIVTVRKEG